ncbi:MAG: hypothetical protein KGL53_14300 [Elusimicrobia bacterium]|nr:hypothetical protein [Elusimicrobiota bacterium]
MTKLMTMLLALALLAPAAAQAQTLESAAANVKATLTSLKKGAKADKTDFHAQQVTNIYNDTDCKDIVAAPGAVETAPVALESRTWEEQCQYIPTPPVGGTCIPEAPQVIFTNDANVVLKFASRGTPAAAEKFQACLWGQSLTLRVKSSPFKYKWTQKDGTFTVTLK